MCAWLCSQSLFGSVNIFFYLFLTSVPAGKSVTSSTLNHCHCPNWSSNPPFHAHIRDPEVLLMKFPHFDFGWGPWAYLGRAPWVRLGYFDSAECVTSPTLIGRHAQSIDATPILRPPTDCPGSCGHVDITGQWSYLVSKPSNRQILPPSRVPDLGLFSIPI